MEKFICIHGHFYQPPRENAWLESVELQDSAYPYHDWNERITAECYASNAISRILDEAGLIRGIFNNYAKISFNFGPTLLSWLERHAPQVYQAILDADHESRQNFSGHGSAIAQAYNHMIMPLANPRDKETQVIWGIRDFEHRFHRLPEAMWLPETAVDPATLEVLAEHGMRFTILAQRQAKRVKPINGGDWQDVSGERIDPTRPYLVRLPSGKSIALFFYDGPISRAVAFEGLLSDGERFAARLLDGFGEGSAETQIVNIASDGESYGHHHYKGNMALAFALHTLDSNGLANLTLYGEYLDLHPPQWEVEIVPNSSWSCFHGVERWWRNCGCNSGSRPGWHQAWRTPLREALDWLRDSLAPRYEEMMQRLGMDPWKTRNDYIEVILDRSRGHVEAFLDEHAGRALTFDEKITALQLLELQRNAMLMYTSCGWFFDEISGLETVQVVQYAGRALQLANRAFGDSREPGFMELLEKAPSNLAEHKNGRRVYEKFVKPAKVDLETVGAHYAIRSLFEEYPELAEVYCYSAEQEFFRSAQAGRVKLAIGRVRITSTITWKAELLCFGALHWGDHNVSGYVRSGIGRNEPDAAFVEEVFQTFSRAEFPAVLLMLEKSIGGSGYSLRHLFRDEQRRILDMVLQSNLDNAEGVYRQVYETNEPLLLFLKDIGTPVPRALAAAAECVLNAALKRVFGDTEPDLDLARQVLEAASRQGIALDGAMLGIIIRRRLERMAEAFLRDPADSTALGRLEAAARLLPDLPFEVNLQTVQNIYYQALRENYPVMQKKARRRSKKAHIWTTLFKSLGARLGVRTE